MTIYLSQQIQFNTEELSRHFYTSSSCGVCGKSSIEMVKQQGVYFLNEAFTISSKNLYYLYNNNKNFQPVFNSTGGNHTAFAFDANGMVVCSQEDVGRHNALDKLIGTFLKTNSLPFDHIGVLMSGRASFELIQKAWMAGISVVAAIGAPSSLAVQLAEDTGMTLIGFLKANSFNVYTHQHRIVD